MRRATLALLAAGWFLSGSASAVDLATIDRTPPKLPALSSDAPDFCLLVFGPQATKRVWLVRDGDVLYVDRNANGDLTDSGERVERQEFPGAKVEGVMSFRAGDIADEPRSHRDLRVGWFKIDHLADTEPDVKKLIEANSKFRACDISIDVDMPGLQGAGLDGRVTKTTWSGGWLVFAKSPADAPILHVNGPLSMVGGEHRMEVGRSSEVYTGIGTPGLGRGTTLCIEYQNVVPRTLQPELTVTFPPASEGGTPVVKKYVLTERCCGVNFHGIVTAHEEIGAGKASVVMTMESWPGVFVAPGRASFEVLPASPKPQIVQISPRLKAKLPHEDTTESCGAIRFSPDGTQLLAGSYPGGVVYLWDVASGQRLVRYDAGKGYRATDRYFKATPDWKQLVTYAEPRGDFKRVERDGKVLYDASYRGRIDLWDLPSGTHLRSLAYEPERMVRGIELSPTGKQLFCLGILPGEFEQFKPEAVSVWDLTTFEYRDVINRNAMPHSFSADGRYMAVSISEAGATMFDENVRVYTLPDCNEVRRIELDKQTNAHAYCFASGNNLVAITEQYYPDAADFKRYQAKLKLYDVRTGAEIFSYDAPQANQSWTHVEPSPDGNTLAAVTWSPSNLPGRVLLLDLKSLKPAVISLGEDDLLLQPSIHPTGRFVAVPARSWPLARNRDVSAEELPQPRVVLIDTVSGQILEQIVAPPSFHANGVFSPDGNTLATSGHGCVLLWDVSDLAPNDTK